MKPSTPKAKAAPQPGRRVSNTKKNQPAIISGEDLRQIFESNQEQIPESIIWFILSNALRELSFLHYNRGPREPVKPPEGPSSGTPPKTYKPYAHREINLQHLLLQFEHTKGRASRRVLVLTGVSLKKSVFTRIVGFGNHVDPRTLKGCRLDMNDLMETIHFLIHGVRYGRKTGDPFYESYYCWCQADQDTDIKYSRELVGLLMSGLDQQGPHQFTAVGMGFHLSPSLMARKCGGEGKIPMNQSHSKAILERSNGRDEDDNELSDRTLGSASASSGVPKRSNASSQDQLPPAKHRRVMQVQTMGDGQYLTGLIKKERGSTMPEAFADQATDVLQDELRELNIRRRPRRKIENSLKIEDGSDEHE